MDFGTVDITKILKKSIEKRFKEFSPQDFEDFIAQLYKDSGFEVEQTSYSGDYGADIIVRKDEVKTAVQIKRYAKKNIVGVQDINQVLGAKDYYKCDNSAVLTTSSFSKQGENLAGETGTELIAWEGLLKMISDVYWDGVDFYTFYKGDDPNISDVELVFRINRLEKNIELASHDTCNIVYVEIENISDQIFEIELRPPAYITGEFKQIDGSKFLSTSFTGGIIYPGCTVEVGYIFLNPNEIQLKEGEKVISKFDQVSPKTKPKTKTIISEYVKSNSENKGLSPSDFIKGRASDEIKQFEKVIQECNSKLSETNKKLAIVEGELDVSNRKNSRLSNYLLGTSITIVAFLVVLTIYLLS